MRARAERKVAVGRAGGVEAARIGELRRVVVRRDIVDHQPVTLGDLLPANLAVFGGGAHEVLHRAGPADRFLDNSGQERAVGTHAGILFGIARQRLHRACGAGAGRIVPGGGDDDVIARHVARRQRRAVDGGVGDHARDIVGRVGAALFGQRGEIILEGLHRARDDLHHLFGGHLIHAGAGQILVLPAEQLLGEHLHPEFVFRRHAEDLHDNAQGIGARDLLHEVHLGPLRDHPVDRGRCQRAQLAFQLGEVARHEPFLRQLAVFGVDRRVEHHQRIDQHVRSGRRAAEFDRLIEAEDDGPGIVEEGGIVLRNPHHVVITCDQPEGIEQAGRIGLHPRHRGCRADLIESVEQPVPLGIGVRIDHPPRQIARKHGGRGHSAASLARAANSSRNSRL